MDDSTSAAPQRYAPPMAEVADVPASGQAVLAGRGLRLVGSIIDGVILLGLFWLVGKITPWNIFSPSMANAGFLAMLGVQVIGFVLLAAVNGYLLATRGQTVGKLLLGMRIARPDGSATTLGRSLGLRYGVGYLLTSVPIVGMAFWLVDSLLIFRADRRCLHDLIADTIVVKN
jgi:uncharacterized RDD family membrane protein YckC